MTYILEHTRIGFCLLDITALMILVSVIILYTAKIKKLKDEQKSLQREAEERAKLPPIEEKD